MPSFKIFTNDRGRKKGVPLYSCLRTIEAAGVAEVKAELAALPPAFVPPVCAPPVAIGWPPMDRPSRAWLEKHVNA